MRILVVDDSPDVRFMLRLLLEEEGMEAEEATSGAAGLERLRAPDGLEAVVLDQRMPDMTGIEVLRAVREQPPAAPLPPIVLFSAYLHPDVHDEARALGALTVDKTDLFDLVELLRSILPVAA
jgi:CheY-like chemotaxis protein